jgi:flagellar biosynthesis activator protein FlaF
MMKDPYRHTQKQAEAPRAAEYRRLVELTVALSHAESSKDMNARVQAIFDNQTFWSHLRLSALSSYSALPPQMRNSFAHLASWVERESVLASLGEAELEGLIAVNKQIIEGLRPRAPSAPL